MKKIILSETFRNRITGFRGVALSCSVSNTLSDPGLWAEIDQLTESFASTHQVEDINKRKPIQTTRQAYKLLGKDPNRYRPSAESLCRRILKEKSLYRINTLVDLINLVSIQTGYSIGGFDESRIQGGTLRLDVGTDEDVFQGIGRGVLNIEGLPLYRDAEGGIGTPTSDEERTKLTPETDQLLLFINGYDGGDGFEEAVVLSKDFLLRYAEAT